MREIRTYGSGKAPDMRVMALAFMDYRDKTKDDPKEEAEFQEWLKEYRKEKGAGTK